MAKGFNPFSSFGSRKTGYTAEDAEPVVQEAQASGMSEECAKRLGDIHDAALNTRGVIQVPVSDEDMIAEIRQHCPPEQLKRCAFGSVAGRGSVG